MEEREKKTLIYRLSRRAVLIAKKTMSLLHKFGAIVL